MVEIDGPNRAWFDDKDGHQYSYIVYAVGCKTPKECMDAYYNWYREQQAGGGYIVWRMRPKLEALDEQIPDPDWGITEYRPPVWRITWRCYVMPPDLIKYVTPFIKPEGEAFKII